MTHAPTSQPTVLIVDDNPTNLGLLLECLSRDGIRVLVAKNGEDAIEQALFALPDLILLDIMMPGIDGFETCRQLKANARTQSIPVIFMTAISETDSKVRGFAAGAEDYVTKPFQHEEVLARVRTHVTLVRYRNDLAQANATLEQRVLQRTRELADEIERRKGIETALEEALSELGGLKDRLHAENRYLQEEIRTENDHSIIVGNTPALRRVLEQVRKVAVSDATVLILGETGTGKELIARAVHDCSPRRRHPMVKLNCAAISAGLVESELFGHVKGAFTGATDRRIGRFELANRSTLFLDEVSELPLETQAKLLRVLQEGELERVGSSESIKVDVRIVVATNRNLEAEVAAGRFRADLYYRFAVFPVTLPPLRERRDDIPALVEHLLLRASRRLGRSVRAVAPDTLAKIMEHNWPGNIRDLQNVVERALILSTGDLLRIDWELDAVRPQLVCENPAVTPPTTDLTLEAVEREHFIRVLRKTRGVIEGSGGAARLLQLKPSTARYRIRKLGINRNDYAN